MAERRRTPYVWVTWLSKVMAGENACLWSSWFRSHYQNYSKLPATLDLVQWNIEHTRLLTNTRESLLHRGAVLRVEGQNCFQYHHRSGAVLAGKPDVVAVEDTMVTVIDCKTGRPKTSDRVQVMLYMFVLPYCFPELSLYSLQGKVVYTHEQVEIAAVHVDNRFGENVDYFLNRLVSDVPPAPAPSKSECRFCDITGADCPTRHTDG
jgi:PD-(D/E)XK nuclease superfamily